MDVLTRGKGDTWGGVRVGFDRVRKSLVIATKDGKAAFSLALLVASQKSLG